MSADEPLPSATSLFGRVKNLLLSPRAEWAKIAAEKTSLRDLFVGFVAPMTAIPFAANAIGTIAFGYGAAGFIVRPSPVPVLINGVILYALMLAGVYLMGLVINSMAEYFAGRADRMQAMKVSAYSVTPACVAGVFTLVPSLGMLSVLGLYSVFLLYRGLPIVMKAPEEKAMGYTALVCTVALVIGLVAAMLSTCATL